MIFGEESGWNGITSAAVLTWRAACMVLGSRLVALTYLTYGVVEELPIQCLQNDECF
jgi:hypothetical protein